MYTLDYQYQGMILMTEHKNMSSWQELGNLKVPISLYIILNDSRKIEINKKESFRVISTTRLHASLHFHL